MQYKKDKRPYVKILQTLSLPFIFLPLIPIVLTDIALELYHRVCFPLYGLPYVKRANYIVFDRFQLSYITLPEKLYCLYCSYANGFFHYATTVALETERYWCGIKHKKFPGFVELFDHKDFVEYGDTEAYKETYRAS